MWWIILYVVGFIVSYILCKQVQQNKDWDAIGVRLFLSLLSWVTAASILIFIIVVIVFNKLPKDPRNGYKVMDGFSHFNLYYYGYYHEKTI